MPRPCRAWRCATCACSAPRDATPSTGSRSMCGRARSSAWPVCRATASASWWPRSPARCRSPAARCRSTASPTCPSARRCSASACAACPRSRCTTPAWASSRVAENLALRNFDRAPLARGPWLSRSAMRVQALAQIAAFRVKTPGPDAPIETLSGGNVQRAVLARELAPDPTPPRLLHRRQPLLRAGLPGRSRDPRATARRARQRLRRAAGQRRPGRTAGPVVAPAGALARPGR